MSHVRPFRGLRYDLTKVGGDPAAIFCPPNEFLTPSRRRSLLQRSPWNFLRVRAGVDSAEQAPETPEARSRARRIGLEWLRDGILVQDAKPSFYVYRQTFTATVGGVDDRFTRTGLVATVDPKAILGTPEVVASGGWATTLPVYLHTEPFASIRDLLETSKPASLRFLDDQSVDHAFHAIDDPETVHSLQGVLRNLRATPLDGQIPSGPGPHLALLVSGDDPGLVLQPVHRIYRHVPPERIDAALAKAGTTFSLEELPYLGADAAEALLASLPEDVRGFAVRRHGSDSILLVQMTSPDSSSPAPETRSLFQAIDRELLRDASVNDHRILDVTEGHRAMDLLDSDPASSLAVLVRPVSVKSILDLAEAGTSVDPALAPIHPRPWSGLVSQVPDA
jgi:hypothetical protein